jgi:hypothetical protein
MEGAMGSLPERRGGGRGRGKGRHGWGAAGGRYGEGDSCRRGT